MRLPNWLAFKLFFLSPHPFSALFFDFVIKIIEFFDCFRIFAGYVVIKVGLLNYKSREFVPELGSVGDWVISTDLPKFVRETMVCAAVGVWFAFLVKVFQMEMVGLFEAVDEVNDVSTSGNPVVFGDVNFPEDRFIVSFFSLTGLDVDIDQVIQDVAGGGMSRVGDYFYGEFFIFGEEGVTTN